jgi:voltage-gated potassium channel
MHPGDERTILVTLSLKTLNPKIKVIAHISERDNMSHLKKARADEVIISNNHSGYLIASHVVAPGIPQFVEQLFSESSEFSLQRHDIEPEWHGKNYSEFSETYRNTNKGILLGIGKMSEPFQISDLMSDDYSYLDEFIMRKFQEAGRDKGHEEKVKILINPGPETELQKNDFYISLESSSK